MSNIKRKFIRWLIVAAVLLSIAISVRYWPRPPLATQILSSTAILDSQGKLLRLTLSKDDQYRVWTPLEDISPQLVTALLLHEDRHFYWHPGVNPLALTRAAWVTATGGTKQGGSTLTMQLARLMYRVNTRTPGGKLKQIILAMGLELRYSKHDLLEAHLNLMPYGGNIQGVGAASLIFFGKQPRQLVLSEALTLVVIPQSPTRRTPGATEPARLRTARLLLLKSWIQQYPGTPDTELVALPLSYATKDQLPFIAPHFTATILDRVATRIAEPQTSQSIQSTLDTSLQKLSEKIVTGYIREQQSIGIHNAAVLLVDRRDMSVRAMVGSANFASGMIHGQVNGTTAKRSPGSALKPFIYALAMDQGLIHPMTVLKDAPTNFSGFSPENFDGRFVGPLTATDALTRSRNVPAVSLAASLREPSFYQFLRASGISQLKSESHYGLALALGGGEVTLEEAVTLYAALANKGQLHKLRYLRDEPLSQGLPLLSPEASYMTLDMLAKSPRPDGNRWSKNSALQVAWKTGTSWGFRDAWTVGVVGPYVLAVWIGNFDGSSNPAFVGVQAAAPLFFRLVDAMTAKDRALRDSFDAPPSQLRRVEVCTASGDLPNADCPQTTQTWFIPGVSPIKLSQIHRRIWIDTRTHKQACPPYDLRFTRSEVFEFWPSDLQQLFTQAGMSRRRPPESSNCLQGDSYTGTPPKITSPATNVLYTLSTHQKDRDFVPFTANVDSGVKRTHWFVDSAYVGTSASGAPIEWHPLQSGRYIVRAVDDQGRADSRELNVSIVP